MWKWIKEMISQKGQYVGWSEFTNQLDDMSLAEFRKKVQQENQRNRIEL